jgi:D-threonate/D-erythronate kinase
MMTLSLPPYARLYYKIDSTLRGNWGWGLKALYQRFNSHFFFVCPSYPEMSRTTDQHHVYLDQTLVHLTHYGNDPYAPTQTSDLVELLRQQGLKDTPIAHLSTQDLQQPIPVILGQLITYAQKNVRVFVCDAITRTHLNTLGAVIRQFPGLSIPVGSAGLAQSLATNPQRIQKPVDWNSHPKLIINGSLNPITLTQLQQCPSTLQTLELDVAKDLITHTVSPSTKAQLALALGQNALVTTPQTPITFARELGIASGHLAQVVLDNLYQVTQPLFQYPAHWVLCGGETSYHLLRQLGVQTLSLKGAISEGIPLFQLPSGRYLVTKSGGFGPPDFLKNLLN